MTQPADRLTFPKSARVRSRLDFARIYDRGRRLSDGCLQITALQTDQPRTRLGLSVSKRCGNAIRRNRWKRVIREIFRLSQHELPTGFDLVIQPRPNAEPEFDAVQKSFAALTSKLRRR